MTQVAWPDRQCPPLRRLDWPMRELFDCLPLKFCSDTTQSPTFHSHSRLTFLAARAFDSSKIKLIILFEYFFRKFFSSKFSKFENLSKLFQNGVCSLVLPIQVICNGVANPWSTKCRPLREHVQSGLLKDDFLKI